MSLGFGPYRLAGPLGPLVAASDGEVTVKLPPKALAVLWQLASQPGEVISKRALLEGAWPGAAVTDDVLTFQVQKLRQALGDDKRQPRYIATVHGVGFRFVAPVSGAANPPARPRDRFVGRDAELARLRRHLAEAAAGQRRMVFISAEAGMGKTTLLEVFAAELPAGALRTHGQCIEHYGAGEAYLPILEALGRLGRDPAVADRLRRHAPAWLRHLPAVAPPAPRPPKDTSAVRMHDEAARALEALAAERLVVLVLEDLHWSDAPTLAALARLAPHTRAARLLVLGTYRPSELTGEGLRKLVDAGAAEQLTLSGLPAEAVGAYVSARLPDAAELPAFVYQRSGGHPLFMAHITDLLASDPEASPAAIPRGIHELLETQLARLDADDGRLLEAAAVAGAEFTPASVAAALARAAGEVEERCAALAGRGRFIDARGDVEWPDGRRGPRYGFRHALYQEVLYQRIGSTRRARLHLMIGGHDEERYGARAPEIAGELALHFERAHDARRALVYRGHAAASARRRSANVEAVKHLRAGLALCDSLHDQAERRRLELSFLVSLAPALIALHGYVDPVVRETLERAHELAVAAEDRAPVVTGLRAFHTVAADYRRAAELGEEMLVLADRLGDDVLRLAAHQGLGIVAYATGQLAAADERFARALAIADPTRQASAPLLGIHDYGVVALCYHAFVKWSRGCFAESERVAARCQELAQEQPQSFSKAWGMSCPTRLYLNLGEWARAEGHAATMHAFAGKHGLGMWIAESMMYLGRAIVGAGLGHPRVGEGLELLRRGLDAYHATGSKLELAFFTALLADACRVAGQLVEAAAALEQAFAVVERHGERHHAPELHRLRGDLALALRDPAAAEVDFTAALEAARVQGAKALELRAACSLARLLRQQRRGRDARRVLAEVVAGFAEGEAARELHRGPRELLVSLPAAAEA